MKKWGTIAVLIMCLALTGTLACNPFGGDDEVSRQPVEVVRGDLTISVSGSGKVAVSEDAMLSFGSMGRVERIYVAEGDEVTAGALLAKLDTGALELALAQVEAALKQAEYSLEMLEESYTEEAIESAELAVEAAEAYQDYVIWMIYRSEDALDDANEALDLAIIGGDPETIASAEALVAAAETAVGQWYVEVNYAEGALLSAEMQLEAVLDGPDDGAVAAAEAQLAAAGLAVAETEKQLEEATIRAPFNGLVARIYAEEGDIISMPTIIQLIDPTSMELEVEVDEIDVADVVLGQLVIIEVDALPDVEIDGEVTAVSLLSQEMGGVVFYKVTIGFDTPPGNRLRVGMSATADIVINEKSDILLVPERAIGRDSQGNHAVLVQVDGEIEVRPVITGISNGLDTEIVNGLSEGDIVVIERTESSGSSGFFFGG